ncbi:MAG TPA: hypothetical protein VF731_11785 [Solirubrobacterales bacterium]
MRRALAILTTVGAALACLLGAADAAASDPLSLSDLRVEGGASSWHPTPEFRVSWTRSTTEPAPPVVAVHVVIRNASGQVVVPETRMPYVGEGIEHLHVPAVSGAYEAEIWAEDATHREGPHSTVPLLFDGADPGAALARPTAAWFGAGIPPRVRVEGTVGVLPISGIRGYAVSVDSVGTSSPCAGPDRCTDAEVDLQGAGTLTVGTLPEGVSTVRVAAVSGAGLPSPTPTAIEMRVDLTPPSVRLEGLPDGWAPGPVRVTARARDQLSGMAAAGSTGPLTALAVDGGAATLAPGDTATTTVSGEGVHTLTYYARDAAGNTGADPAREPATASVRVDESPPSVAFTRSQDPAEPERIEARVSDPLSGPSSSRGSIAVRRVGTAASFQALPTSVSGDRLVAVWDSDAFPPGSYEFRATAYDEVGNSARGDRRLDGARMILANPLKRQTLLQLGFGGRRLVFQRCARSDSGRHCHRQVISGFAGRPTTRSIGYGHGESVSGQLTDATGQPLAAMPIELIETFDSGSTVAQRTMTVQTGTDGRFIARLAPGPGRRVEAVFPGSRVQSRAGAGSLRLEVLGSVRLRASRATAKVGGKPVLFSGQVGALDARLPASGRPVELQFRVPGRPWSEFRTVQTDARGRFRYAYSFTDDDSRGVRFQFRAVAPASEGWPYETAASRPVFVTGR